MDRERLKEIVISQRGVLAKLAIFNHSAKTPSACPVFACPTCSGGNGDGPLWEVHVAQSVHA